jgi:Family of unknown function (DUF6941)
MLADGAHVAAGKLYVLGGQFDRLFVASFPAQHPAMAVVLVLKVEYSEAMRTIELAVSLTLDGQSCDVSAIAKFATGHAPDTVRGAPAFVPMAIPFSNVSFAAPGRYEWVITVDGEELARLPLQVAQAPGTVIGTPQAA